MAEQQALWHDTLEDALRDVVQALGGPKRVGVELWPSKSAAEAGRLLNHCLDPERAEKLALGEVVWIMRRGAAEGCHVGLYFLTAACGYEPPRKLSEEERRAELQREFIDAVNQLDVTRRKIERLMK